MTTDTAIEPLTWHEAEWADTPEQGESAYHPHGVVADVGFQPASFDEPAQHWWSVSPTARLTETPEMWGCGSAESREEAKAAAEASVARAVRHYADAKGPLHPDMRY